MTTDCVFCTIAAGDVDADVVLETGDLVAFLDRRPVFKGHVLLVPREHVVTLPDLPAPLRDPFLAAGQRLATAMVAGLGAQGSFVALNNVVIGATKLVRLRIGGVLRLVRRGFFQSEGCTGGNYRLSVLFDLQPVPVTWPVGYAGDFRGLIDRRTGTYVRYGRTAHGSAEAAEVPLSPEEAAETEGETWTAATDELELLDSVGAEVDSFLFRAGEQSPAFVGSAITNFGVRPLLDALVDLAPQPTPRVDEDGAARKLSAPFSAQVFKVQANMDPSHRDRVAFVRVCSGRFERGMVVTHDRTGKPFATKYAHSVFGQERETLEEAYPGDIVALVNATDVRVGDTLYVDAPVEFPRLPEFAPEHFHVARVRDTGRFKQFRRGVAQLDEEGVVQVLRDPDRGDQAPVLAAVGPMQLEVALWRLEHEFGAPAELSATSWTVARRTDDESEPTLRSVPGVDVLRRADGSLLAVFESPFWLARVEADHPGLTLEKLIAEGSAS
jgi:peptide chain release factor 3